MGIYIFYWLVFSFLSIIESLGVGIFRFVKLHRILVYIVIGMLVFIIGFRWETATDWFPYYNFYKNTVFRGFFEPDRYMDYGYVMFNDICYFISDNYSTLLVIHSIVFFLLFKNAFQTFTPYVVLCLFVYISTNYGMTGSNRQLMAVAFGMMALAKYLQKEYFYSLLYFVIALLFHNTAVLLLLYFLFNRRVKIRYLLVIFMLCVIIGNSEVVQSVFMGLGALSELTADKVDGYNSFDAYGSTSISGVIRRLFFVVTCILFADKLRGKNKYFDLWFNTYLYTVFGLILFAKVPVLGGRAMLYFNMSETLLFAYLISILPYKMRFAGVLGISFLMIIYFFQSFQEYPTIFLPYKGIFINESYNRS